MKTLLVCYSYHHKNTAKIAHVIATILKADVKTPEQVEPKKMQKYDLVGFGSGIYANMHHESLIDLADTLPRVNNKKAFIFSTCGIPSFTMSSGYVRGYIQKAHTPLRERLLSKGYTIVDEFNCVGFNTHGFLKLFGGINRGRPNAKDLHTAEEFARNLGVIL